MVDEAHITAFHRAYESLEAHYLSQGSSFLGLTATPWRLSKKEWLGERFDVLVQGPQPPEIVRRGKALPCRGFTIGGVLDLDQLHIRNGDYIDSEIAGQACDPKALAHVVSEWQRLASSSPTLMIGATIEQAFLTRDEFTRRGIPSETIIGSTPQSERLDIFERVRQGLTLVITSVGCLTAGFDLPLISAIAYVRATKSKSLFFQSAGRGSRPSPGKQNYILLDFGGNLKRFGNPMGYQVYDISQPQLDEQPPKTKTCPNCSAEITVFARICPECGYEFGGEGNLSDEEDLTLSQLGEFLDRDTRAAVANLRRWKKQAYQNDVSPDQPIEKFVSLYGYHPPSDWLHHSCLTRRFSTKRLIAYLDYLDRHVDLTSRWSQNWLAHHMRLEFGSDDLNQLSIFDWHEVLGISQNSTWLQVKESYTQLARQYDPNLYAGDSAAKFEEVNAALDEARLDTGLPDAEISALPTQE